MRQLLRETYHKLKPNVKGKLRTILRKAPRLESALSSIYRKIRPDKNNVGYWIKKFISNREIQVLQIGSNDGISGDSLNKLIKENNRWQVLFVEPIPDLFEKLKKNYGSKDRFKFENAGINVDGSKQKFYRIGDAAFKKIPSLSEDYKQIGSFSKAQVEKLSTMELIKFIEDLEVSCMSLEHLLEKHKIETLDLIQIDAEGYDWKILSQLDLRKYKPRMIIFENENLQESEKKEAIKFLQETYYMALIRLDYMCIRKDKLKPGDIEALSSMLANKQTGH